MFLLCASAVQVADFHSFILMSFCQEKKVYEEYTITFFIVKGIFIQYYLYSWGFSGKPREDQWVSEGMTG